MIVFLQNRKGRGQKGATQLWTRGGSSSGEGGCRGVPRAWRGGKTLHSIDGRPMITATTATDIKGVFRLFWLAVREYSILMAGADGATDEWRGRWTTTQAIF